MHKLKGWEGPRAEYISIKIRTYRILSGWADQEWACIWGSGVEQKRLACQTSSNGITFCGQGS